MTRMFGDLSLRTGVRITPGDTLVVIDEIQACPLTIFKVFLLDVGLPGAITNATLWGVGEITEKRRAT